MTSDRPTPPSPPALLKTARLILRAWSPADAVALKAALDASRPELARFTPWVLDESDSVGALRQKLARFAERFHSGTEWRYAIATQLAPTLPIGECGLYPRVGPSALEIGYWLAVSATGHGFATEAAAALTAQAFRLSHIEHVEIRCDPANAPSMRVPQRLGYRARPAVVREDDADARRRGEVVVWDLDRASVRRA